MGVNSCIHALISTGKHFKKSEKRINACGCEIKCWKKHMDLGVWLSACIWPCRTSLNHSDISSLIIVIQPPLPLPPQPPGTELLTTLITSDGVLMHCSKGCGVSFPSDIHYGAKAFCNEDMLCCIMEQHSSLEEVEMCVCMCREGRLNVFVTKIAVCVNFVDYDSPFCRKNKKQYNYSGHMQGNVLAALIRWMQNDNVCVCCRLRHICRIAG